MSLTLSNALRSAQASQITASVDSGIGAGKIRIYTGPRPASPNTAITTQTLLAEFTLADPSFGSPVNGTITLDATPTLDTVGLAAGDAVWFRVLSSDDVASVDGKVSASGGGGDLILNTTTVSVGLNLSLTAGSFTMPVGTAD